LLERYGGQDLQVESSGTEPRCVNPLAIHTVADYHIDRSAARSASVSEFLGQSFD
jgi:protein-tyrosine-phosphatase